MSIHSMNAHGLRDSSAAEPDGRSDAAHTVIVASDVRLYTEGLALVFAADTRLRVSHTANSAAAAIECFGRQSADALLIDATMPGVRDVLHAMRERVPHIPVVIFGVPELDEDLLDYIEGGAAAFVSRESSSRELIDAVLAVTRGETSLSRGSLAHVLGRLASRARQAVRPANSAASSLTARETELASLLDEGLSNKEIAQQLHISVATVKNHVHRILEKLQIERRGQAASRLRHPMMNQRI